MTWGIVAAAGASLVGGMIASNGAQSAADTQSASADKATALQKQMFDKNVELQQPWHDTGVAGLNQLAQLLGIAPNAGGAGYGSLMHKFGMSDFQQDPGYQFRMSEGMKGLDRAAAAGGRFNSGRAAKDLMRFSQGLASQEYGNAYDRFNNNNNLQFNRFASMAGLGQTAANNIGGAASAYGQQAGNNIMGAGNAQAAGMVGGANAINNGIGQGVSMYQQNQLMNKLFPSSPSAGGGGINPSGFGTGFDADQFWGG